MRPAVTVLHGDCLEQMRAMEPNSVDAIVCDPPYGLEFMGKQWDSFRGSNSGITPPKKKSAGISKNGAPVFSPNRRNQKCPDCNKWAYDHPGRKCECGGWKHAAQLMYSNGFQAFSYEWAVEALRVAKPGAHLVAFGGTRTFHRLACAIEDAGWEIRDTLSWMYGSGFPKSLDVSKAMDKAAGAEREEIGRKRAGIGRNSRNGSEFVGYVPNEDEKDVAITAPATDAAKQWAGWGTALKPGWEPIILARKPLAGTVAKTVSEYGTGALNIDGCRIGAPENVGKTWTRGGNQRGASLTTNTSGEHQYVEAHPAGRWPANVVLSHAPECNGDCVPSCPVRLLDEQSGATRPGHVPRTGKTVSMFGPNNHAAGESNNGYGDTGGASRFYYTAKASRREREAGLEGMPRKFAATMGDGIGAREHSPNEPRAYVGNVHPTVKPLALMRWLCRLVTPPGGVILDPFTGSGSTGCAAVLEGFRFLGIEQEAEYVAIAERRIAHWAGTVADTQPELGVA